MVSSRLAVLLAGVAFLLTTVNAALDPGYPTDLPPCCPEHNPGQTATLYAGLLKQPRQAPPGTVPFQEWVPDRDYPELPKVILRFGDAKVNRKNVLEVYRTSWAIYDGGFKITVTYSDHKYPSHFALPPMAISDTEGSGCLAGFRDDVIDIAIARA